MDYIECPSCGGNSVSFAAVSTPLPFFSDVPARCNDCDWKGDSCDADRKERARAHGYFIIICKKHARKIS